MITGTVPPSTDHAAPVTLDAAVRAQEGDHRGDLVRGGQPADRGAPRDLLEHLLAGDAPRLRRLVGQAARTEPQIVAHRARERRR